MKKVEGLYYTDKTGAEHLVYRNNLNLPLSISTSLEAATYLGNRINLRESNKDFEFLDLELISGRIKYPNLERKEVASDMPLSSIVKDLVVLDRTKQKSLYDILEENNEEVSIL